MSSTNAPPFALSAILLRLRSRGRWLASTAVCRATPSAPARGRRGLSLTMRFIAASQGYESTANAEKGFEAIKDARACREGRTPQRGLGRRVSMFSAGVCRCQCESPAGFAPGSRQHSNVSTAFLNSDSWPTRRTARPTPPAAHRTKCVDDAGPARRAVVGYRSW
jgi:hypothetical protein